MVEAVNEETDETFVVRGDDLYLVVVELAQQCASAKTDSFHAAREPRAA